MKIKYIAWKQVISSDVNRLIYGTQGNGLHNKGDQAIQNFNSLNENPGLWHGFTNGEKIPRKIEVEKYNREHGTHNPTTFNVELRNSVNSLCLWEDKNDSRNNPIKINHEIWDRKGEHSKRIIESWYLGYMRILEKILKKIVQRDGVNNNAQYLLDYVSSRLSMGIEIKTNVLKWIHETQDGFCELYLDTSFMMNSNIKDLIGFVEDYYYLVVKCEDNGIEFNMALMANSTSGSLHPKVRSYLKSNKFGGCNVDIDVSAVAASPDAQRFLDALYSRKNIILYGPPGTGKTHLLTELDKSFNAQVLFDDLDTEAPFRVTGDNGLTAKEWCTFHPNTSYESFVCGLEPVVISGNKLGFKSHIGPMLKLAKAAESGVKSLLIIDEINRANTDSVFGDTISIIDTLIDDVVTLPQPIKDDSGRTITDIKSSPNLFIVGTMNSLDKSTSQLSSQLKRRFCVVEMSPNVEVLRSHLEKNKTIKSALIDFACEIMQSLNAKITDYCGKEYTLGQGYFWGLVEATENHEKVLAEILKNKIMPHLRDVLPANSISAFFGSECVDVLYYSNEFGYEIADCSNISDSSILNSFSKVIGSDYEIATADDQNHATTLEEHENAIVQNILEQLKLYKNVILNGCSGTGKTYYLSKVLEKGVFQRSAKMHWHSSTEYADVIEGISATIKDNDIEYSVKPGAIRKMAEMPIDGESLMVIENINKSNAAENFGELITLLEPDKRDLQIRGYDGYITIPKSMHFLCTMTPSAETKKLDSALKRRFSIIEFSPDYRALSLKLKVVDHVPNIDLLSSFSSNDYKCLAIEILKALNSKLRKYVGIDAQIGQAAFWTLPDNCDKSALIHAIDDNILPYLEEFIADEDISHKLFGDSSPMLIHHSYGLELGRIADLAMEDQAEAFKGLLQDA